MHVDDAMHVVDDGCWMLKQWMMRMLMMHADDDDAM